MKREKRAWLIVILIALTSLLGLVFIKNLIDFRVYYEAGHSLLAGRADLYSPDFAQSQVMDYRYPPFFLIAFYPLWVMPYPVAAYLWYLLGVVEIFGCVIVLRRVTPINFRPATGWVLAALAVAQYFVMILHYGNAHLLAVSLLFAALYFARRGREPLGALLLSLSITIKLTPVLILPYFALKRRWKLFSLVVLFLLLINAAPAIHFGWAKNADLLNTWFNHVVRDQEFHEANGPINLSLKGQLQRYLTEVDYSKRVDGDVNYPAVNVARLSPGAVSFIWMFLSGLILAAALSLVWRAGKTGGSLVHLEVGLMISVMLMIEPLTSKIYFIALLWPAVVLASVAFDGGAPAAVFARRALCAAAIANVVLPLLPGRQIQRLLLVLGADFYVNLLLAAALAYALISATRPHRLQSDERQRQALSAARTP